MKYKQVYRDEFVSFIKSWPHNLEWDVTLICDPPLGSYNDFSDGKVWPESIVAKIIMDWMGPNGEEDRSSPGKYWKYLILGVNKEEK